MRRAPFAHAQQRHQPLMPGSDLARARSLDGNFLTCVLTKGRKDTSGLLKLAEALPHSQLTRLRSAKTALERCFDFAPSTVTSL